MREYKFRAWDAKLKHMFPVQRLEFSKINGELMWMSGVDIHHKDSDFEGDVSFGGSSTKMTGSPLVKRYHLMQYTGLKDRNGKEIYEGDVFPATERTRGEVTIVCYDSNQGRYKAVPLSLYKANAGNGGWTGFDLNQFSEVIDNIHDNPELLTGGNHNG